ncbi:hypothetical protein CEN49_01230 [Fischerella thermalis CCMEE 5273]|uniref:Uncharacterized protein n=1 Tax=Chlorogloeopsis fritschii PCC 6912 TaxID=211165 RepID=A0A3S1ALG3_CHLFR|nr:hypothetical protein [Chlorogloeopsis fritschii]PMB11639.1 hypothetical protein CEN49_01230 [Fischerella thermalis CCMEE 5273]PMB46197.1 hypothetical protein CEN40_10765 [Fischerella thermalis CCMEE 5205]RUR83818.1 hypothetical protein PCC6912_20610 [Chlorogloeopsis fritschii PCC 6912]
MNSSEIKVKKIELTSNGWTFNSLSPRVGTITNPKGRRITSYFGFDFKEKADKFLKWITCKEKCSKAIVRPSERLTTPWEVKAWDVEESLIVECALKDLKENAAITIAV